MSRPLSQPNRSPWWLKTPPASWRPQPWEARMLYLLLLLSLTHLCSSPETREPQESLWTSCPRPNCMPQKEPRPNLSRWRTEHFQTQGCIYSSSTVWGRSSTYIPITNKSHNVTLYFPTSTQHAPQWDMIFLCMVMETRDPCSIQLSLVSDSYPVTESLLQKIRRFREKTLVKVNGSIPRVSNHVWQSAWHLVHPCRAFTRWHMLIKALHHNIIDPSFLFGGSWARPRGLSSCQAPESVHPRSPR